MSNVHYLELGVLRKFKELNAKSRYRYRLVGTGQAPQMSLRRPPTAVLPRNNEHEPAITNEEFIQAVFTKTPEGASAWVTGFAEDPAAVESGRWYGQPVAHGKGLPGSIKPQHNNFFAISSFKAGADGEVRRRKDNFAACHVIMVDDIGTKVQNDRLKLPPSYLLETSPENYQAGYLLDTPETDCAKVNRLLDEMVRSGLAVDGKDPGMKGVTRYCRLPVDINNKARYVKRLGETFAHRFDTWDPGRTYTVEAIAEAYGLDLTPPKAATYHRLCS